MALELIEPLNLDTGKLQEKTVKLSVSPKGTARPWFSIVDEHHLGIEQIGLCMSIDSVMMFPKTPQVFR